MAEMETVNFNNLKKDLLTSLEKQPSKRLRKRSLGIKNNFPLLFLRGGNGGTS